MEFAKEKILLQYVYKTLSSQFIWYVLYSCPYEISCKGINRNIKHNCNKKCLDKVPTPTSVHLPSNYIARYETLTQKFENTDWIELKRFSAISTSTNYKERQIFIDLVKNIIV